MPQVNAQLSGRVCATIEFCARLTGAIINGVREACTLKFPRPRVGSAKPLVRQGLNFHGVTALDSLLLFLDRQRGTLRQAI